MSAPQWAQRLLERVWAEQAGQASLPALRWRRSSARRYYHSSGRGNMLGITVTAGTHRPDQRAVLLHEIAHALDHHRYLREAAHGRASRWQGHGPEFWRTAWRLYTLYRGPVTLEYLLGREDSPTSLQVAATLNIRGAWAMAAQHRKPQEARTMATTATRTCPGVKNLGIEAHEAPLSEFAKNAGRPDGIARNCRSCGKRVQAAYVARKRDAAGDHKGAAKAARVALTGGAATATAHAEATAEVLPEQGESPDAKARRQADEAAVAAAGGAGTEQGQQVLAEQAEREREARRANWRDAKRRQREARKAELRRLQQVGQAKVHDQIRRVLS